MLQVNQFGIPLVGADIYGFIVESGFQFIGMLQFNQFGIPLVRADICGFTVLVSKAFNSSVCSS